MEIDAASLWEANDLQANLLGEMEENYEFATVSQIEAGVEKAMDIYDKMLDQFHLLEQHSDQEEQVRRDALSLLQRKELVRRRNELEERKAKMLKEMEEFQQSQSYREAEIIDRIQSTDPSQIIVQLSGTSSPASVLRIKHCPTYGLRYSLDEKNCILLLPLNNSYIFIQESYLL